MATIHFVKDGKTPHGERLTNSVEIPVALAVNLLGELDTSYSPNAPTINPEIAASDYASYRHVVFEVAEDETCSSFPQSGFYIINGCDESEGQRMRLSIPQHNLS